MRAQRGIAFAFLLGIVALATLSPARMAAFIRGFGPPVEEPALTLVPSFPYSAPYEDVKLKP